MSGEQSRGTQERFELERQAMGRLGHPHIVPAYSYGHTAQHGYLIMKLIG